MELLNIAAVLVTLAAVFAFINFRFIGLPTTIGVMMISLVGSAVMVVLSRFGADFGTAAVAFVRSIDFNKTVLDGMLSFLLFAGAMHIDLDDLKRHWLSIGLLASVGVLTSTFLIGGASWYLFAWLDLSVPFLYCLLFGALISPTDPVAVLAILRNAGAPKKLRTNITGESLFNDGVGVVVFLAILGIVTKGGEPDAAALGELFAVEVFGGAILGLVLGGICFWMLRQVADYKVEVLLTLALVMGGYMLALSLHMSGPIAMVVAGLLIGNHGFRHAVSEPGQGHLATFWELIDEILNVVLFMLIGLEVVAIAFQWNFLLAGLMIIPVVLMARFIAVGVPVMALSPFHYLGPGAVPVLTWAGLRGGISVALALALPLGEHRDLIVTVTYYCVLFSIVVQGLSISRLVKRFAGAR